MSRRGDERGEGKHGVAASPRRVALLRRAATVTALALAAWALVAWWAARALVVSADLGRADALVVLAGSSTYVERTREAARLFGEGRAPRVILTDDGQQGGWSSAEQRNPRFVERAAEELRRGGVPAASVEVLPGTPSSTHEEAEALRRYAAARGLRSLLVVTSAYHSRRALWALTRAFEGSGVETGLHPVAPGAQTPRPATWWLHPAGWKMVAGEYPKLVYYRLRY